MPVVRPGDDHAATARKLIAKYGAENVTTRSEPGFGVVFVVPDAAEDEPDTTDPAEPQGAPAGAGSDEPQSASEPTPEPEPEPEPEPVKPEPKKAPAKKAPAEKPAAAGAAAAD